MTHNLNAIIHLRQQYKKSSKKQEIIGIGTTNTK